MRFDESSYNYIIICPLFSHPSWCSVEFPPPIHYGCGQLRKFQLHLVNLKIREGEIKLEKFHSNIETIENRGEFSEQKLNSSSGENIFYSSPVSVCLPIKCQLKWFQ